MAMNLYILSFPITMANVHTYVSLPEETCMAIYELQLVLTGIVMDYSFYKCDFASKL